MTDAVSWLDLWKRRMPAFLARISVGEGFGTGLQVDEDHVVTCAHVVHPRGPQAYYDGQSSKNVEGSNARVFFGNFETTAVVKAQHPILDLVVLQLKTPRYGVTAPLAGAAYPTVETHILGIARGERGFTPLLHPFDLPTKPTILDGMEAQQKHLFGAPEGTSGGGVYSNSGRGPIFRGIAVLGGERLGFGSIIAAESVLHFVVKSVGPLRATDDDLGRDQNWLRYFGIAPSLQFGTSGGQMSLVLRGLPPAGLTGTERPTFLSQRVISACEARQLSRQPVMAAHDRLPAWAESAEDAEAVIQQLSTLVSQRLRLPTRQELETAWGLQEADQLPIKEPKGRPITLYDFRAGKSGFGVPPIGVPEWTRGSSGVARAVYVRDGKDILQAAEFSRSRRAAAFRIAFDVEGT